MSEPPIWAEIDCAALCHNFQLIRKHVQPAVQIMAVVKANAYGHGLTEVAEVLAGQGTEAFGVARLEEARQLRGAGLKQMILIFGYTPPKNAPLLAAGNIVQAVYSLEYARALNEVAQQSGCRVRVHVKCDTGMGRLGFPASEGGSFTDWPALLQELEACRHLQVEGMFTHFASSDGPTPARAWDQLQHFQRVADQLGAGAKNWCVHAANSAATMVLPEAHGTLVRPGIMLYGLRPSGEMDCSGFSLQPVMSLKARIAQVKIVPRGFSVSYGHTHVTSRETMIATVPVGYADGYARVLSSRGAMLVHGRRARIVGRVCMDQTMIDVGHIADVQAGDEVVILGCQGREEISADEIAALTDTINYEVVSSIMQRVPRVYLR